VINLERIGRRNGLSLLSGATERRSNLLHLFFSMIWVNLISQTNHVGLREVLPIPGTTIC
jgi:hypothetical protein